MPNSLPPVSDPGALVQLHVAEYTALTTRNNNWVQIQVAIWTLILLFITVAATMWKYVAAVHPAYEVYVIWGGGIVVQLALAMLYFSMQELYRNVLYIETVLRPWAERAVGDARFWGYESFLSRESTRSPTATDAAAFVACCLALVAAAIARGAYSHMDELIGFLANLPFTAFLGWQTRTAVKLREKFQSQYTKVETPPSGQAPSLAQ